MACDHLLARYRVIQHDALDISNFIRNVLDKISFIRSVLDMIYIIRNELDIIDFKCSMLDILLSHTICDGYIHSAHFYI